MAAQIVLFSRQPYISLCITPGIRFAIDWLMHRIIHGDINYCDYCGPFLLSRDLGGSDKGKVVSAVIDSLVQKSLNYFCVLQVELNLLDCFPTPCSS